MGDKQKAAVGARVKTRSRSPMATILRGVPKGYDWGWFSREDPRMHVQVIDDEHKLLHYKVWLENRGRRAFEPEGKVPGKVLQALRAKLETERERIEILWTGLMVQSKWISAALHGSIVTLTAYPKVPGSRFTRTVDLKEHLPGIYDPSYPVWPKEEVRAEDIFIRRNPLALGIWPKKNEDEQVHISLPEILWED
jgi:hypothetical protein